jgi:large subunit ribosomal protein L21
LTEVLAVGGDHPLIGTPLVSGAKVLVTITKQARTRKKLVFKKKRRHSYRKFQTHKQDFTEIFVKSITAPGGKILKADSEPSVKDMAAERLQRISDKQAARKARVEARIGQDEQTSQPERKKAVKKVVKKAAAKKKVATKKKSSSAKKKATKKVSKKA